MGSSDTPKRVRGKPTAKEVWPGGVGRKPGDLDSLSLGSEQVPKVIGTLPQGEFLRV